MPWMQIDRTGETRARMLGVLLGIGEDAGVGLALRLWRGALEISPDGDFRGLVADPETLGALIGAHGAGLVPGITALQRVGFVETEPRLRVRGLDRYERTWRKNSKPHSARRKPGANPARKTETESKTEIEKKKKLAGKGPPPEEKHADWQNTVSVACEVFERIRRAPYPFNGRDAKALAQLYEHGPPAEFLRAWVRALEHVGYPSVSTLPELVTHLAHFLGAGQATAARYS